MAVKSLNKMLKPERIALTGVPNNPKSIGGIVLSNLLGSGFEGVIYMVNFGIKNINNEKANYSNFGITCKYFRICL